MSADSKKYEAFTVRESRREGGKPYWIRIGTMFANRDGSFTLYLDAQPLDGKVVMREPREWDDKKPSGGGSPTPF